MEIYKTIKKFLAEGGKCLLIEDNKPIGVVLTVEEYEKLQNKGHEELIPVGGEVEKEKPATNPIGEAMAKEMDFSGTSAEIADIEAVDDVTLEDLGVDPDIQLPKDF